MLDSYVSVLRTMGIQGCYTDNERFVDDTFAGRAPDDLKTSQAIVGVINARIGAQAAAFVSPSSSGWTRYIGHLMSSVSPQRATASLHSYQLDT